MMPNEMARDEEQAPNPSNPARAGIESLVECACGHFDWYHPSATVDPQAYAQWLANNECRQCRRARFNALMEALNRR
jgi:hypothetical protein